MALQFGQDDSLRAQRMTAGEARAVIDLWQQERVEQTGLTDKPAVPDVAEGLGVPVADIQRLLSKVRARRLEEEARLAQEQQLSEIHLAEEERRLAEIRRQRAELRREQAEAERRRVAITQSQITPGNQEATLRQNNGTGIMIAIALIWLLFIISLIGLTYRASHSSSTNASDCVLTLPNGTSQPCGQGFYQAHPDLK